MSFLWLLLDYFVVQLGAKKCKNNQLVKWIEIMIQLVVGSDEVITKMKLLTTTLVCAFSLCLYYLEFIQSFRLEIPSCKHARKSRIALSMNRVGWTYTNTKPNNFQQKPNHQGNSGELFFLPDYSAKYSGLPEKSKPLSSLVCILPRNVVVNPITNGEELGVFEMRYREMINDIGLGGYISFFYYSQETAQVCLAGTLAKVIDIVRYDDGGMLIKFKGIRPVFLDSIVKDRPYIIGRVNMIDDFVLDEEQMRTLEIRVLNSIRYSVKLLNVLYPQNKSVLGEQILKNMPCEYQNSNSLRVISINFKEQTKRRSTFSFAAMDMIRADAGTKLSIIQEPYLEKRYSRIYQVIHIY